MSPSRHSETPVVWQVGVEFLGTFLFLVIIVALAFDPTKKSFSSNAPLAIGIALAAMIFAFGTVSGGHFNPAVTCAKMIYDGFHPKYLYFLLAQILAGILAALFIKKVYL